MVDGEMTNISVQNLLRATSMIMQKIIKVCHSHEGRNPWIEQVATIVRSPIKDHGDDGIVLVNQNLNILGHQ